jgi:ATP-dependent helicase HrpB
VVIDSGLERRATFDIKSGVTRLETRPIAKASATQRAGGRAARPRRLLPALEQRGAGAPRRAESPDILTQELTGLLMDAAQWGPG